MKLVTERLELLRAFMRREHLSAFIFPSTDPHNSEYVPDRWKGREWISGFNGSAGTAVVTLNSAALWTDSRYFIAAADQLSDTEFQLMKLKVEGTPEIEDWLKDQLAGVKDPVVGIDGWSVMNSDFDTMFHRLSYNGIILTGDIDPLNEIWTDRPQIPSNKVELQPMEYAGEPASEKLSRIRQHLADKGVDALLVSALDEIAWILNLRGSDVHCNPVFVSYLFISKNDATLFINKEKLTSEIEHYLSELGVDIADYSSVRSYIADNHRLCIIDPRKTNAVLSSAGQLYVLGTSPVPHMKNFKNEAEQQGFRNAHLRDGIAMVKFLKWLKPAVEKGGQTEMSLDEKLTSLRRQQPLFRDISFDTIVGYEAHGAIVHYEATPETDIQIGPCGLVLIDSGAQYQDGTTDITRTIALGPVTEEQKRIYTLVLKGHIQLELAKFPDGCSGTQIDCLAREAMWREGYNYLHGTGHGVGSYLNVHEGPHQIRMEYIPTPLHAGMTVTDEPGIYLADKFGVRIENTLLITPYMETEFGKFLQMESLTLCPIDTAPIEVGMLSDEERQWLNDYHQQVFEKLSPYLDREECEWLADACKKI